MKKSKKILAGIMTVCFMGSMTFVSDSIAPAISTTVSTDFLTYDGLQYYIYNNDNDDDEYITIAGCDEGITELIIPEQIDGIEVRQISWGAFIGCTELVSVTIPEYISDIGQNTFMDCINLKEINVSEGNQIYYSVDGIMYCNSYGTKMCYICPEGKKGDCFITDGTEYICDSAFENCQNITSINVPESVSYIGYNFASGCPNLTAINVDENNQDYYSDDGVLYSNSRLLVFPEGKEGSYTVADGTYSIENYAFENCTKLTSVTIPDGVELFGYSVFTGCESLNEIIINATSTTFTLDNMYDSWYEEKIPPVFRDLPDGEIYLGKVLVGYKGEMPENTDIIIKDGTTAISQGAFLGKNNLNSITIPNSVEAIGERAFDCNNLTAINVSEDNEVYSSVDGVLFKDNGTILVQYPASKLDTSYTVPDEVNIIYGSAFEYCKNIEEVTFPESLEILGNSSFSGCKELKKVNMPSTLEYLGMNAFSDCSSLEEAIIPYGISDVNYDEYKNCNNIKLIDLPESVSYFSLDGGFYGTMPEIIIIRNSECDIYSVNESAMIIGYKNSSAQRYAEEYGCRFVTLGNEPPQSTTSASTYNGMAGDANSDDKITIADAVLIMQSLSNGDDYKLSEEAIQSADVVDKGDGLTSMDALAIQMIEAKIITADDLPITSEKLNSLVL